MPRAIIKNPVGNVGDVREDVKILLSYENDVQYFDMTLSKKNENYSARFHYEDGAVVVDSVEGGQYSTELSEKLNYLDDIIAITNMNSSFYNLSLITENNLFYQMKDLEEIIEAYLNGGIEAGEIDKLGYWKTLFSFNGEKYVIGDKLSGNDISIFMKDDEVRFGVNGAEVKNDGLSIINKDVLENVFTAATENGACYLPMTRYEELLEFLGTKLSEFENPSQFLEKERVNIEGWYDAEAFGKDGVLTAYYNHAKYTLYKDGEIEQGVPNIVVEYENGGNQETADMMKEKIAPVYSALIIDTEVAFEQAIENELPYFSKKSFNELCLYALNNSSDDLTKLFSDGGFVGFKTIFDEEDEPTDLRDYELGQITEDDENYTPIRKRVSDRYGHIISEEEFSDELVQFIFDSFLFLPVELYQKIVGLDYQIIPATGIGLNIENTEITIGDDPQEFGCSVFPANSTTGGAVSFATNDAVNWIQSGTGSVSVSQSENERSLYYFTGIEAGEVVLTGVTVDGGFSESVNLTVYPQMYNITLSHIDGPGSPMEVEEGTVISTDGDTIYIGDLTGTANVEQGFVFDYFTATIDGETITMTDGEDITVESDMTLTAVSHENVSSDITLTLASSPSGHTTFMDGNQQTISSVTIPVGSTIYTSGNQVILGGLEDQDTETIVDANVEMPYAPDHRELNGSSLEDFTDYTVQTSGTLTLVIS